MAKKEQPDLATQDVAQEASQDEPEAGTESVAPDQSSQQDLLAALEQKDDEIRQLKDRILRMAAEMDNTRKRLERERSESISFANEGFIRDLLPIVDNLERALEHSQKEVNIDSLMDGVKITLKTFRDSLARFGCAAFDTCGKAFDPNYHEAVMQQETADHPENTVLQELQKGYTLHDRLLRPAMVVVSKTPAGERPPAPDIHQEPPETESVGPGK